MPARREQREHVCVLTIDRPQRANAIDLQTARQLSDALTAIADDAETRVVVLTAAGDRVFSAGMDLAEVQAGKADAINGVPGGFAGFVRRELPQPVIAAVDGAAIGGGFEIVLACDLVVAGETARFALPEVGHGLIAASGGLVRLPRRIPGPLACEMLLTGAPLSARRAAELGLVNRVVAPGAALDEALALAAEIAQRDPDAVRASIALARMVLRGDEEPAWRRSAELATALGQRPRPTAAETAS